MLLRILVDNPGPTFTRNINDKFVLTAKLLLQDSRDPSVQQIMRETLQHFDSEKKKNDSNLSQLISMWQKERTNPKTATQPYRYPNAHPGLYQQPGSHSNGRQKHQLPDPGELSGRIEEARTTAKLLIQLVQTTPPSEFDSNDLIKEFADRCQSAQRNLDGYMNCTNPSPDESTLQTLIETGEQLSLASSKHQRAKLAATRHRNSSRHVEQQPPVARDRDSVPSMSGSPQVLQQSQNVSQAHDAPATTSLFSTMGADRTKDTPNPFSDNNSVGANHTRGFSNDSSRRQYAPNGGTNSKPPRPNTVELPDNALSGINFHPRDSLASPISPPSTSAPKASYTTRSRLQPTPEDDDLYSTSPGLDRHSQSTTPGLGAAASKRLDPYEDLDSLDSSQDKSPSSAGPVANGFTSSSTPFAPEPLFSTPPTRDRQAASDDRDNMSRRVREDEPMSPPLGNISGTGWRY